MRFGEKKRFMLEEKAKILNLGIEF